MELKTLEKIVLDVLNTNVDSRFSDHVLCTKVIFKIRPNLITTNFKDVFNNFEAYKLPSFASVERCRRKLAEKGLYTPPENIKKEREKMIEKYVEYAVRTGGDLNGK